MTRKIYDLVDASFQAKKAGVYAGGGSTLHGWPAATGSTGVSQLPNEWSTIRYGVFGMDDGGIGVGGVEGGIRLHAPTRFSPYVGLSGNAGFSSLHSGISHNPYNNPKYPPNGAPTSVPTGLLAIVPEAGVSYWLNSSTRLNAGASYYVADGRPDFLVFGLSLELLSLDGLDFHNSSFSQSSSRLPRFSDHGISSARDENSRQYFLEPPQAVGWESALHEPSGTGQARPQVTFLKRNEQDRSRTARSRERRPPRTVAIRAAL